MEVLKLIAVFAAIILILRMKRPLWLALCCGALATVALYGLSPLETLRLAVRSVLSADTLILVSNIYLITFLQRMMEHMGHLELAQKSLSGLFNNRRVNASVAPMFVGLLPSPGAIFIAGSMVNNACEDHLPVEDRAFIASYFRHISESFMPTYAFILFCCQLSGVPVNAFVLGMIPMVALLILLGYWFELRRLPKDTGVPPSDNRRQDMRDLIRSIWSIAAVIALILAFDLPVCIAILLVIVVYFFVNRFTLSMVRPYIISSFESNIIVNTFILMIFRNLLTAAGVIEKLPVFFEGLPIPAFVVFFLIFFCCTMIAGSTATITLCTPLAFATIPSGGLPLMVLLMSCTYAAMQISPAHICLFLCCDYFKISIGSLIKKTLPVIIAFYLILFPYYFLLNLFFS